MDSFRLSDENDITALGFSTKKRDPLAVAIRWLTKSKCSHAWVMYKDVTLGALMVLEATSHGFRVVPYKFFRAHNDVVDLVPVRTISLDRGIRIAARRLGAAYDAWGLVGAAFVMLGRWLKRQWKNPLEVKGALYCSEIVTWVLIWSEYPGSQSLVPSQTTPEDLHKFIRKGEAS